MSKEGELFTQKQAAVPANKQESEAKRQPEQKETETKTVASSVPAKKMSREELELKRKNQIQRMTLMQLVEEAPKERFIAALLGVSSKQEAEQLFIQESGFARQAFRNNDLLTSYSEKDKEAVIEAIINVAQTRLTLNPVLKLGYLVPMNNKVLFWASYMGKREIVMRTGLVKDAYARLVYEGDKFEIKYGTGGYIKHVPDPWKEQKLENIKGGYWYCLLLDGTEKFGTMNESEIRAIQKRSPSAKASQSPWTTDWEQMALKTIFNRGFKEMPKSGISDAQLRALEIADRPEEETLKQWIKSVETKQDRFDDDSDEDDIIVDVDEIKQ